jgi:hypothetical protein
MENHRIPALNTRNHLKFEIMKTPFTKAIALILLSFCYSSLFSQAHGEIRGLITNTGYQPVPYATVKILQGNQLVGGTQTDEDGKYKYKPLIPGQYEMVILEPGHQTQQINKIKVVPNEATYVDVKLQINTLGDVTVTAKPIDYTRSGVDVSMFNQISMNAEELNRSAGYNRGDVQGALEVMSTDSYSDKDGEVHFRGSRGNAAGFFIDGVRTQEATTIPGLAIENISVFPGGVPAMYGDVSSGVVIITTKSYFSGIRDKNIRMANMRERDEAEKAKANEKENEEKRLKEIEEEKQHEKK